MAHRSVWHIFTSPVRFFQSRVELRPVWIVALSPVIAQSVASSAAAVVAAIRGQAAIAPALARFGAEGPDSGPFMAASLVLGVLSTLVFTFGYFALSAGAVVFLDLLFAQSGRARRLVEFTGYAHLPQVVWALVALIVLVGWWTPAPFRLPPSVTTEELPRILADYRSNLASTPLQISLRMIGTYFGLWLVALQCAALRVVSGFSIRGAVAAGVALSSVFVVIPWVLWA